MNVHAGRQHFGQLNGLRNSSATVFHKDNRGTKLYWKNVSAGVPICEIGPCDIKVTVWHF